MSDLTLPQDETLKRLVIALDEDSREFFEERAGILEYMAGHTRAQAEKLAWNETVLYQKRKLANKSKG
jgi:hypothetical protein